MKRMAAIIFGTLLIQALSGAEPAKVSKKDVLREKPFIDAKTVLSVKQGQAVDIQKREGSWYFVKALNKTGWVPMLSVHRTQQAAAATSGSLTKTATGRSATGGVVSTTGVRGLNEETLKNAAFSDSAVAAAEKYRVSSAAAAAFAKAGGLQAHAVPSLATPLPIGGKK
jgi:uncharacterized protein YgiM (DUF1202 family)